MHASMGVHPRLPWSSRTYGANLRGTDTCSVTSLLFVHHEDHLDRRTADLRSVVTVRKRDGDAP